jgi:hypothetical protein
MHMSNCSIDGKFCKLLKTIHYYQKK